ncbi:histidine kinase dimerization/phospho-acceptor domain-containing protein [Sphingomonas sp. So64.6b]|uniref:histidine kinase dimerization/phospho-acceptor domain-containing protein n=1 Tax=Sphingomonas sp. So64.6b TaxID=2997354 RepID=UPI001FCE4037|nr:histidine kinase dimerization/phospho-acceptor domain-containing protein [Sphingomonas sp. So64.6b]
MGAPGLRFDDSLETVLSADMSTPFGAQSAWRQLVDLIGRRRVPVDSTAIARLQVLRAQVPPPVRAASARSLAFADPPAALVQLFADDEIAVAAPVLRVARMRVDQWIAMLPGLSPAGRSVLRHRRDLAPEVRRALESFGAVDFRLPAAEVIPLSDLASGAERSAIDQIVVEPGNEAEAPAGAANPIFQPPVDSAFVSLGSVALGLPVVAEALRLADDVPASIEPQADGPFQINELLQRIDAYQRQREDSPTVPLFRSTPDAQPALFELEPVVAPSFRFETDAAGVVRWIEGAARAALIGLSLDFAALPNGSRVDGVAAGAFRRRAGFANARLVVDGQSDAAGQWRITGIPVFDRESGRFTGYRGTARRPRADESAEPIHASRNPQSDALRQLVHELRTPTNAIAGFAEMIETQLLGPVPQPYRDHAGTIRNQVADLLTAIDDIDLAARIESNALDLRPGTVPVAPLLAQVAGDLAPLAGLRGSFLTIDPGPLDMAIAGDDRAVERLIARLMATLVASGSQGETIGVTAALGSDAQIIFTFDRPRTLAAYGAESILTIDAETEAEAEGAPLLGTGFALRLARNLAAELGGALAIGEQNLTLCLPAAVIAVVEQASSS